ncbi:MAG: SHOCT domain-containing protein [Candidatus Dojkabacteria bacterium]|nr:MAG: SHOCT domain-containing protein [Candidatus Dojkabacteria bacterium]
MGRLLRAAVTAQAVSSARTNRAIRKNIEGSNQAQQQAQAAPQDPQMQQAPMPAADAPVADAPAVDYAAELQKLADLRDKGILTEEEFTQKKQEILAKM